jgi:hypothetical protein
MLGEGEEREVQLGVIHAAELRRRHDFAAAARVSVGFAFLCWWEWVRGDRQE